jgi:hypothetical protein
MEPVFKCLPAFLMVFIIGLFLSPFSMAQNWQELTYDDFEGGWGNYVEGGNGNDVSLNTSGSFTTNGTDCANIQDDSGSSYFELANGIDVTSYDQLRINYAFQLQKMESGEGFELQYFDGTSYVTLKSYAAGSGYSNNTLYEDSVTVDSTAETFPVDAKIRFYCTGTGNRDDAYIDAIRISGYTSAPVNQPPAFTADPFSKPDATEDAVYSASIASDASDPESDTMTFSKVSGPAWLNVASDGTLSGTPSNADVGLNAFTVQVDATGGSDTATLNITVVNVNDAPTFTADPINEPNATEDAAYSDTIAGSATDVDVGDTLTYSKVSGPAWLSVAANGALSGTPSNSDAGLNAFTVEVADGNGGTDQAALNITVDNVNDAPIFTADPINEPNATEDAAYSDTIAGSATDVDAGDTLTYSKVSGPAWLSVAANGALSGTPSNSDVGANAFTVEVADGNGGTDQAALNVTVDNVNDAPVFGAASYTMPNATENAAYSDSVGSYATDVDAGDTLTYSKVSGPAWLSVATDGSLSGTPASGDVGVNYFTVRVADSGSLTDDADLEITVDTAPSGGSELLSNGDFEIGTPTADQSASFDASPWQRYIVSGNNNSWVTDDGFDAIVGSGNQCVELRWGVTYIYQNFTAIAGEDYTISCESLQLSGNQRHVPTLQVEWYDASSSLIGSVIDVDSVAAADTGPNADIWVAMSGVQTAPAGAAEGRVKVILNTNASGTRKNCYFDNVSVVGASASGGGEYIGTNAVLSAWAYNNANPATLTASSQLAGLYAVGNRIDDSIEVADINGTNIATITSAMIQAAAGDLDLSGNIGGPCSLAFTPSGRLLFIGICSASGSGDKDAVLMYNFNLDTLRVFDRLVIDSSLTEAVNYGMAHYKGELFVGTEDSLESYAAGRNDTNSAPSESIATAAITGLAVDMAERTGSVWTPKLYASTDTDIYRIDPSVALNLGSSIASGSDIKAITFGRTYGGASNGGLYVLENAGSTSTVHVASTVNIRGGGSITLEAYKGFGGELADIAATACGRMLLAETLPGIMSDSSDSRLDFNSWMVDEFNQYRNAIKSLIADGTGTTPEGFLIRKIVKAGDNENTTPIADNVGWALYLLMAADIADPNPENEQLIEQLLQRHVGEHPDGLGGKQTVDGTYSRVYNADGTEAADPQAQVYVSMKMLPAAYKAVELYPTNANLAAYKEKIRSTFKRASDTINADKHITWTLDDHGPVNNDNGMSNETWLFGEIGAAQDPACSLEYYDYVYHREDFDYDYWLASEPVIKASHSAFIVMGSSMILRHHNDEPGWDEQNRNYYAVSCAAGDDLGSPYFAAFSAGSSPVNSYFNDGPSSHPGNTVHFPAVLGLGQQNRYSPMVGGYLAYRDGLRQDMQDGISMLTRWSYDDPSFEMASIGIADFWFGAVGLAEAMAPGMLDVLRDEFFRPTSWTTTENNIDTIHFSKITPRRILGSNDQTNWVSYGFQLSPFTLEYGDQYTYYGIADREGELIDVPNGDFENGTTGWTKTGDYSFLTPSVAGISIVGTSAEIRSTGTKTSPESSLSQTLDMSLDLENTEYIIRADGNSGLVDPDGQSYLRIEWDNDSNAGNGVLSIEESNVLDTNNERVEFRIDTTKPAGATHLHIYCVAEMGIPVYDRYVFDNVSMVRLGADATISNGDFESGMTGWTESSGSINLTTASGKAIDGTSLLWSVGPGLTGWKKATYSFDVSSDPDGTRYLFSFDAKALTFVDSEFEIAAECYDSSNSNLVTRVDITDVIETTDGERRFTLRKRPEYDHIDLRFRMRRNSSASPGTDEVVIDNLRLKKEQLF